MIAPQLFLVLVLVVVQVQLAAEHLDDLLRELQLLRLDRLGTRLSSSI